jgi:hypothetical protein
MAMAMAMAPSDDERVRQIEKRSSDNLSVFGFFAGERQHNQQNGDEK